MCIRDRSGSIRHSSLLPTSTNRTAHFDLIEEYNTFFQCLVAHILALWIMPSLCKNLDSLTKWLTSTSHKRNKLKSQNGWNNFTENCVTTQRVCCSRFNTSSFVSLKTKRVPLFYDGASSVVRLRLWNGVTNELLRMSQCSVSEMFYLKRNKTMYVAGTLKNSVAFTKAM